MIRNVFLFYNYTCYPDSVISSKQSLRFKNILVLLFILLGFQYELVQDWTPNIGRWKYANLNASIWDAGTGGRDIEPFFMYLLKLFKPITFLVG